MIILIISEYIYFSRLHSYNMLHFNSLDFMIFNTYLVENDDTAINWNCFLIDFFNNISLDGFRKFVFWLYLAMTLQTNDQCPIVYILFSGMKMINPILSKESGPNMYDLNSPISFSTLLPMHVCNSSYIVPTLKIF